MWTCHDVGQDSKRKKPGKKDGVGQSVGAEPGQCRAGVPTGRGGRIAEP